jgi:hypothetical protein
MIINPDSKLHGPLPYAPGRVLAMSMYEPAVQTKQFNPIQMLVILKSSNSILRPDWIERIAKD